MAVKEKEKEETQVNVSEERKKVLNSTLEKIEKAYGKGAIMRLGDKPAVYVEAIPTGALSLDVALGIGGIPRGRIIEIYGPEASGKTTLAQHIVSECQKRGGIAAFIDAEHALDPEYARNLGVNVDELLISQPDTGEQALEITEELVRSSAVDIIVVDSVAALVPKDEIEGAMEVMYGNPETTTGGTALKYYSSIRLDIRKIETLKKDDKEIGNRVRVKVAKNKVAPPFRQAEFDIIYGKGISKTGCILDMAVNLDIIKKAGAWFSYNDEKIGQGRDKAKDFLMENPTILAEVEKKVRETLANKE